MLSSARSLFRMARNGSLTPFRIIVDGQCVWLAHGAVFGFSAVAGLLTALRLKHSGGFPDVGAFDLWVTMACGLGGLSALVLAGNKMGGKGIRGLVRAFYGALWITCVGAIIAGTLALPLYGTMFAPLMLGITFVGSPELALLWFANFLAIHVLMWGYRSKQDRFFERIKEAAAEPRRAAPKSNVPAKFPPLTPINL